MNAKHYSQIQRGWRNAVQNINTNTIENIHTNIIENTNKDKIELQIKGHDGMMAKLMQRE